MQHIFGLKCAKIVAGFFVISAKGLIVVANAPIAIQKNSATIKRFTRLDLVCEATIKF